MKLNGDPQSSLITTLNLKITMLCLSIATLRAHRSWHLARRSRCSARQLQHLARWSQRSACRIAMLNSPIETLSSPIMTLPIVGDTSAHRQRSVHDASSSDTSGDPSPSTQPATLCLPLSRRPFASPKCVLGIFFFSFWVNFFVNFCLMILVPLGIFV